MAWSSKHRSLLRRFGEDVVLENSTMTVRGASLVSGSAPALLSALLRYGFEMLCVRAKCKGPDFPRLQDLRNLAVFVIMKPC